MTDKQHLRTWELHRLQHIDMFWWRNNYRMRLELHTLEVLQTPSVGEVCEYPKVSSFLNSYLVLELVYVLASCSIKKWKKNENERNCHGDNIEPSSTNHHGKYSNVLLLTLNKALPGGRPRITRFILILIPSLNKAQSCFMLPLSILVCSGLNVCCSMHSWAF